MPAIDNTLQPKTTSTDNLRQHYQSAVAGTFYRTMLKSLHAGEQKPAYLNGGMAEEIFRSRLDDRMSEILADSHGDAFSQPFYDKARQEQSGRMTPDKMGVGKTLNTLV